MSVIDRNNNIQFKSAEGLFADVRRFLRSFDNANLIDEGEFPQLVKNCLSPLGRGVMKPSEAIVKITSRIVDLPDDFKHIEAVFRCKDTSQTKRKRTYEQGGAVLYNDITKDILYSDANCSINCITNGAKIIERVTIKQMVADSDYMYNFSYPQMLHISNSSISPMSPEYFQQANAGENVILIENNKIYLNFEDDWLYIRYYAIPKDEYGVPMIPDIDSVYQALKWYIIYQVSLSWWWNNDVPDLQNKWKEAEYQYTKWMGEASYEVKLPSFDSMMDAERAHRKTSLPSFFTRNMYR